MKDGNHVGHGMPLKKMKAVAYDVFEGGVWFGKGLA